MIPITELEMAANSTFTSILNEIQLSNLNFNIKMTPFGAYITLKKTVQKDRYGNPAVPSPPLLLVLHQAHQEILRLQKENYRLKSAADTLRNKHEHALRENEGLVESFSETTKSLKEVTANKDILDEKIYVIEKEAARNRSEIAKHESEIKKTRKQHVEEIKDLNALIKTHKNEMKVKDKKIHDLTRNLENSLVKVQSSKSEVSRFKIIKSKLEAEVKKLKHEKTKTEVVNLKSDNPENEDFNANHFRSNIVESVVAFEPSSHSFISSLVSHGNHHFTKSLQQPSNISSMVTHSASLPPPGSSSLSISEVLSALDKAVAKLNESMKWC